MRLKPKLTLMLVESRTYVRNVDSSEKIANVKTDVLSPLSGDRVSIPLINKKASERS
jgi:hypothetical protein